jgi:hypothetical protein
MKRSLTLCLLLLGCFPAIGQANPPLLVSDSNDAHNFCAGAPVDLGAVELPADEGVQPGNIGSDMFYHQAFCWLDNGQHLRIASYFFQFDFSLFGGMQADTEILMIDDMGSGQGQIGFGFAPGLNYPVQPGAFDLTNALGWSVSGAGGEGRISGSLTGAHDYSFDLAVNGVKNPVPQDNGFLLFGDPTGAHGAQKIYSRRLSLEGTVILDGIERHARCNGLFERQFGPYNTKGEFIGVHLYNGLIPPGSGFVTNVGTDIEVYRFRDPATDAFMYAVGSISEKAPGCGYTRLAQNDFSITYSSQKITSPQTGKKYPKFAILSIPSTQTHLLVMPTGFQEINLAGNPPILHVAAVVAGLHRNQIVLGDATLEFPSFNED